MLQEELPELCEIRGDRMRGCANVSVRFARFLGTKLGATRRPFWHRFRS